MAIEINSESYRPFEDRMKKTCQVLQENLNTIRAGRANPKVLEHIKVLYYGTETALSQLANIQVPEARMIVITPYDMTSLKSMEKAIQTSDLGINPNNDGKCLRLNFPSLTEERRKDLVKQVQKYGEESKVAVRNIRRDAVDLMKAHNKKKEIGDDVLKDAEAHIQKMTDKYIAEVDKIVQAKDKDLMEI